MVLPVSIALGLSCQSVFVGANIGINVISLPMIRATDTPAVVQQRQFVRLYDNASKLMAPLAIASGLLYCYGAFQDSLNDTEFRRWIFCSVCAVSALPVTLVGILPTVNKLKSLSDITTEEEAESSGVGPLIDKWGKLSLFRTVCSAVGYITLLVSLAK